jgi:hypothetical protein
VAPVAKGQVLLFEGVNRLLGGRQEELSRALLGELAHVLVSDPGGVGEQVPDQHLVLALALELGKVSRDRPVQADPSFLDQGHYRCGSEHLTDRGEREKRIPWGRRGVRILSQSSEGAMQDDATASGDEKHQGRGDPPPHPLLAQFGEMLDPGGRHPDLFGGASSKRGRTWASVMAHSEVLLAGKQEGGA